ncbi:LysM peptidoglycan-binding domain-containing protein [Levilactobacillus namurensis]|uniref:LysM peptidoglycan-binding domain-containing protein n=1 Tax=Levilactobacillus namurensis TaxID=380393 RepID=UPI0026F1429D|nr:LysM peptidoglycan-binding domain-containing protein [Levilactobacillus namurensis]
MAKKNGNSMVPVGKTIINGREVSFATYRVQDGDTIYSVWLKLRDKTTVGALKTANQLQTNTLVAGKIIKIPLVL